MIHFEYPTKQQLEYIRSQRFDKAIKGDSSVIILLEKLYPRKRHKNFDEYINNQIINEL